MSLNIAQITYYILLHVLYYLCVYCTQELCVFYVIINEIFSLKFTIFCFPSLDLSLQW